MDIRIQGYENQVKLFLVLLVLFLASVGIVSLNTTYRTQSRLLEEAESRIVSATRAASREMRNLEAGTTAQVSARLQRIAKGNSLTSLEITDARGRVLASSEPWRVGIVDPIAREVGGREVGSLASGGAVIREPASDEADAEYGRDRGEAFVFMSHEKAPAGDAAAEPPLLLKAGHEVIGVRAVTRQIRWLAWLQTFAAFATLVVVLLFSRWVLRPYKALRETAARLETAPAERDSGHLDDPDDLISSFRGVIDKLKEQEDELDQMRRVSAAGHPGALSQEQLDGLTSGVMMIDRRGVITTLNPAGEAILGRGRDEIVGLPFSRVFSASPELLGILEAGVHAGRSHSREVVQYAGRGGSISHLGVTVSPLPSEPSGAPGDGGAFCLLSDLTEIRGVQELVRLKENLARLGEMSAGIAHEFRNALAAILGYARLIDRQATLPGGPGGPIGEHAAAIVREVQSMGRIVDDFLRYARPASLHVSRWDPRQAVAEVMAEVERQTGRSDVRFLIEGQWPGTIRADEGLMRQAICNLLLNAVEAMGEAGGTVRVSAGLEEDGKRLRIEVSDSGPGIPEPIRSRLFTPFVTSKRDGTGMGLAMAQKTIVSHDGAIEAKEAGRGGASFVIRLPVEPPPAETERPD